VKSGYRVGLLGWVKVYRLVTMLTHIETVLAVL
jgi:hypothetical protein